MNERWKKQAKKIVGGCAGKLAETVEDEVALALETAYHEGYDRGANDLFDVDQSTSWTDPSHINVVCDGTCSPKAFAPVACHGALPEGWTAKASSKSSRWRGRMIQLCPECSKKEK